MSLPLALALAPVAVLVHGQVVVSPDEGAPGRTALIFEPVAPEPTPASAPSSARLDEVWVSFVPKIQVLAPGTTLVMTDRDDESHTVHAWFGGRTLVNRATVPAGAPARVRLDDVGVVTITCDIHSEMRAFVLVSRGRYAHVTGPDGRFEARLPEGRYRVRAWREADDGDRQSPPGVEPGQPAGEVPIAGDKPLRIVLPPPRVAAPAPPRIARAAPPVEPTKMAPTFVRHTWPQGRWALALAALGMAAGVLGAFGNVQLAARKGWSLAAVVGLGITLAGASAALTFIGLHGAIGAALGLGLLIGTAVFAAEERPPRT